MGGERFADAGRLGLFGVCVAIGLRRVLGRTSTITARIGFRMILLVDSAAPVPSKSNIRPRRIAVSPCHGSRSLCAKSTASHEIHVTQTRSHNCVMPLLSGQHTIQRLPPQPLQLWTEISTTEHNHEQLESSSWHLKGCLLSHRNFAT